MKCWSKWKNVV